MYNHRMCLLGTSRPQNRSLWPVSHFPPEGTAATKCSTTLSAKSNQHLKQYFVFICSSTRFEDNKDTTTLCSFSYLLHHLFLIGTSARQANIRIQGWLVVVQPLMMPKTQPPYLPAQSPSTQCFGVAYNSTGCPKLLSNHLISLSCTAT